jgi:hypothetical protein
MTISLRSTAVKSVDFGTQLTLSSTDFLKNGIPTAPMAGDVVQVTLGGFGHEFDWGTTIPELPENYTGWTFVSVNGENLQGSELVRLLYVVPSTGFPATAWPQTAGESGVFYYRPLCVVATCWSGVDNATPRDNPSQEKSGTGTSQYPVNRTDFPIPNTGNGYITGASAAMVLMSVTGGGFQNMRWTTPPSGMTLAGSVVVPGNYFSTAVYYQEVPNAGTNVNQKVATSSPATRDKLGYVWGLKNYVPSVTPPASVIIQPKIGWGILL